MHVSGEGPDDPSVAALQAELTALFANMGRAINRLQRQDPTTASRFEFGVLARLAPGCTLRLGELAEADGLDPSTMSRRVAALEERGLVVRRRDPEDGRAHRIGITDAGRARLQASREARVALVTDALAGWTPADRGDLARLLGRLNESLVAAAPVASHGPPASDAPADTDGARPGQASDRVDPRPGVGHVEPVEVTGRVDPPPGVGPT